MSRQIQIRRGTADEHSAFTGAVGEITMDTTNKTIRVHDGETAGGTILAKQSEIPDIANADYVVETQVPTAENNYTWYRKYKSGWIEQGGSVANNTGTSGTINLPVTMADNRYIVVSNTENNAANNYFRVAVKTTTTMNWYKSSALMAGDWMVLGFVA